MRRHSPFIAPRARLSRAVIAAFLLAATPAMPRATALIAQAAPPTATPTADEAIARFVARVGGMERIAAITSLRRTGRFVAGGGFEARYVQENSRPGNVREEFTMQGMTAVNAFDGSTGWKIDPFGGKKDPEPLSEDEMHSILLDADFDDPIIDYARKGHAATMVGMDQIEGTDVWKVRLAMKNGDTRWYYLDKDSYVPIRMEETRVVRGAEQQYETNLGDYKAVNGWLLPFAMEVGRKGQDKQSITWTTIDANVALPTARYAKPLPPETR